MLCGRDVGLTEGPRKGATSQAEEFVKEEWNMGKTRHRGGKGGDVGKAQAGLTREEGLSLKSVRRNLEACGTQ